MEKSKKLITIAEMSKDHFAKHPEQPVESIKEYIKSLKAEDKSVVTDKLKESNQYYKQFQEAILHTSFIITLAVQKTLNSELDLDLDTYTREFLFFARKDDSCIYNMRMYYLDNLDSEEMGIGYIDEEDLNELTDSTEKELVMKESKDKIDYYNKLINNIKKQYSDSKVHLV